MKRTPWHVALALWALWPLSSSLAREPVAEVLLQLDLGAMKGAVSGPGRIRAMKFDQGYAIYATGFLAKSLGRAPLRVEVEAASPDGATLGVRLQPCSAGREKLDGFSVIWNQELGPQFRVIARDHYGGPPPETDCIRIFLYRSNRKGTLFLKSLSLARLPVVATEKLVSELEAGLRGQGYRIERRGELLVGKKAEERCYYHAFPGEMMNPKDFASRAYAGTTRVRTEFQPDFFPIGPYIYGPPSYQRERAKALGMTLEGFFEHLAKDVQAHGGNAIYYANLTMEPEVFKTAVAAAVKHGVQVFGQLTMDLYLRPERGRQHYEKVTLPTAARILPRYRGLQGVAAWMPKEEAHPDQIDMLAEYRAKVRELDPTHGIFTLHNNIETFRLDDKNLPEWFGFDRYRFRCLHGTYGILISTPKDMARRLRGDIREFCFEAEKRGRPLVYVMQGYGHQNLWTAEDIRKWSGGARTGLDPWSGFKEIEPDVWKGWDRYPPPENGMFLQCWLAVLEGAKGLLIYFYGPPEHKQFLNEIALVDREGKETRLWREFAECVEEMKPLLPLFLSWHKEALPRATANNAWIAVNSFIRRFDAERFLVVLNQRIATWDEDSPAMPRGKTELHFDEHGLAGLHPAGPLTFKLKVEGQEPLWEILTGRQLDAGPDGTYELTLGPGRATVLMQGPVESLRSLRSELRVER